MTPARFVRVATRPEEPRQTRIVYQGDEIIVQVEGGVVRRRAPEAGISVDVGPMEAFLPWRVIDELRAKLAPVPAPAPAPVVAPAAVVKVAPKKRRVRR